MFLLLLPTTIAGCCTRGMFVDVLPVRLFYVNERFCLFYLLVLLVFFGSIRQSRGATRARSILHLLHRYLLCHLLHHHLLDHSLLFYFFSFPYNYSVLLQFGLSTLFELSVFSWFLGFCGLIGITRVVGIIRIF